MHKRRFRCPEAEGRLISREVHNQVDAKGCAEVNQLPLGNCDVYFICLETGVKLKTKQVASLRNSISTHVHYDWKIIHNF
jgi:hypothetical protein